MKKLLLAVMLCFPLYGMAQNNVWEIPDQQKAQQEQAEKKKAEKEKKAAKKQEIKAEDMPYLAGAVPEVDGHVVFTLDKDVPGMSAEDIYNKVYVAIDSIVAEYSRDESLVPPSRIAAINKAEHTIAARLNEWLVFSSSFISLDRTQFTYTLIAQASEGHIHVTMERISYAYEVNRKDGAGLKISADKWITDKASLNKSKTKLSRSNAKFRRKTIDRKNNIFGRICEALDVAYTK